jgi:hypothetical protein
MSGPAVDAAVSLAAAHGVRVTDPVVLLDGSNLLLHLRPAPIVARVPAVTARFRHGDAWLRREVAVAGFLHDAGAPVVAPSRELPPGPHARDGQLMTFFEYARAVDGPLDAREAGRRLRLCHDALRGYPGELPRHALLEEARALVDVLDLPDDRAGPLRHAGARIRARLDALDPELRPVHGDGDLRNVIQTESGPLWNDWEDACLAPLAWDLRLPGAAPRAGRRGARDAGRVRALKRDASGGAPSALPLLSGRVRSGGMGFYVRKSLRAGPFRFNLSKSGLGVSAGVPGFRVGTGPRGNYVHVGSHGVYYRASLGGRAPTTPSARLPGPPPQIDEVLLEDVTGATATELQPTGPGDLVDQLNQAASRPRLAPWLVVALVVTLIAVPVVGAILLIPGIPAAVWLWYRDRARRSVVAFYEVHDGAASWFEELVGAFEALAGMAAAWRVNASGRVRTTYQYKTNAGASSIVSRAAATASLARPPALVSNIAVPSWTCGRQSLHFLPDRLLVRDGSRYSDVTYTSLEIHFGATRFIESGRVPRDAQQVDTTWRYVNVKGGPDRRFNNNVQLPVMLYGELELASPGGLHWLVQCSRPATAERAAETLRAAPSNRLLPASAPSTEPG